MAHPYSAHRQTAKEHSRVGHIVKGYKSGGAVHPDAAEDRKLIKSMVKKSDLKAEGDKSKHRMDRPKRAKGGRVGKHNAKTVINVITGGHPAGGAIPPVPAPMPPPAGIAGAAMPPPAMAKPPMPMGPPPGGPPPGMPMRAKGGRVGQTPTGSGVAANTKDAEKNYGSPVFNQSMRNGTQISGTGNNKDDGKDIGRGRVVTFWAGGKVKKCDGGPARAKGGRVESPPGVSAASKLPGGAGGGEARLAKEHRAERKG